MANYKNIQVAKLPKSEAEITGEISKERLIEARKEALKKISQTASIDGFRKGHIPESVLVKHFGDMGILQEAAELALSSEYPKIIEEHKLDPIGYPQVTITKIALGDDLGFKIKTALMPEVKLPDYKKIARTILSKKEKDTEATDTDVENTIKQIQTARAKANPTKDSEKPPELTDEFVKTLGAFENVEDFKKKLKENISVEKKRLAREKKRAELAERLAKDSEIDLPEILIESELAKMLGQFKHDIEQAGLTFEKYLAEIKKTETDITKEWRPLAENKARLQLVLNKIATEENITAEEDQVKKELEHIKKHYPEADDTRSRIFVETMLTNEKVFQFLDAQVEKAK